MSFGTHTGQRLSVAASRGEGVVCHHLYSWYGSEKLCFLQTPSKNEQNQTTKNRKT